MCSTSNLADKRNNRAKAILAEGSPEHLASAMFDGMYDASWKEFFISLLAYITTSPLLILGKQGLVSKQNLIPVKSLISVC